MIETFLVDEAATQSFATRLAEVGARAPLLIYFYGEIGAGKTTFIRAYLHASGVQGSVKSPSFALIEPYQLSDRMIYHIDLYRLSHAGEIEDIGLRDYFNSKSICCVEWPQHAGSALPPPDLAVTLDYCQTGRQLKCIAQSPKGVKMISKLTHAINLR